MAEPTQLQFPVTHVENPEGPLTLKEEVVDTDPAIAPEQAAEQARRLEIANIKSDVNRVTEAFQRGEQRFWQDHEAAGQIEDTMSRRQRLLTEYFETRDSSKPFTQQEMDDVTAATDPSMLNVLAEDTRPEIAKQIPMEFNPDAVFESMFAEEVITNSIGLVFDESLTAAGRDRDTEANFLNIVTEGFKRESVARSYARDGLNQIQKIRSERGWTSAIGDLTLDLFPWWSNYEMGQTIFGTDNVARSAFLTKHVQNTRDFYFSLPPSEQKAWVQDLIDNRVLSFENMAGEQIELGLFDIEMLLQQVIGFTSGEQILSGAIDLGNVAAAGGVVKFFSRLGRLRVQNAQLRNAAGRAKAAIDATTGQIDPARLVASKGDELEAGVVQHTKPRDPQPGFPSELHGEAMTMHIPTTATAATETIVQSMYRKVGQMRTAGGFQALKDLMEVLQVQRLVPGSEASKAARSATYNEMLVRFNHPDHQFANVRVEEAGGDILNETLIGEIGKRTGELYDSVEQAVFAARRDLKILDDDFVVLEKEAGKYVIEVRRDVRENAAGTLDAMQIDLKTEGRFFTHGDVAFGEIKGRIASRTAFKSVSQDEAAKAQVTVVDASNAAIRQVLELTRKGLSNKQLKRMRDFTDWWHTNKLDLRSPGSFDIAYRQRFKRVPTPEESASWEALMDAYEIDRWLTSTADRGNRARAGYKMFHIGISCD